MKKLFSLCLISAQEAKNLSLKEVRWLLPLLITLCCQTIQMSSQLHLFSQGQLGKSLKSETSNYELTFYLDALIGIELIPVKDFYLTSSLGYSKIFENQKYIRPLDYHYYQGGIGYKLGRNRKWLGCEMVFGNGRMKLPIDYANLPKEMGTRNLRNSNWKQKMWSIGMIWYPCDWLDVTLRFRSYFSKNASDGIGKQSALSLGFGFRLNIPKTLWPADDEY